MMQVRDGEAPERKVSRYTVRPGTLGLTLVEASAAQHHVIQATHPLVSFGFYIYR